MVSEKQREGNRKNAERSTGPRTGAGKARSRWNSLRHGLTAQHVVVPGEKEAAFNEFAEDVRVDLRPVGAMEEILVEQVVACAWRLRRALRVEKEIFERESLNHTGLDRGVGLAFIRDSNGTDALTKVASRYENSIRNALHRGLRELERLQAARRSRDGPAPSQEDERELGSFRKTGLDDDGGNGRQDDGRRAGEEAARNG